MSTSGGDDGFLARWSRRKQQTRHGRPLDDAATDATGAAAVPPAATAPKAPAAIVPAPVAAAPLPAATPAAPLPAATPADAASDAAADGTAADAPPAERPAPPTLADVAALTRDSDFSRFVRPGVDNDVRLAAMRKLFYSDPHFNTMDGLDVYIDDYGKAAPIPRALLRQLAQSGALGLFDDEQTRAAAAPAGAAHDPPACSGERPVDEDPDLQLQPDDAAGAGSAGDGAEGGGRPD